MRATSPYLTLALGLAVAGLAVSCRTIPSPPSPEDDGLVPFVDTLSASALQQSRAFAHYAAGIHHEVSGEFAEAEAAYRRALAEVPDADEFAVRIGVALVGQRKVKDALTSAEGFLSEHPSSQATAAWLGSLYLDTGEGKRAAEIGQLMAERFPTNALGWSIWSRAVLLNVPEDAPGPSLDILFRGTQSATPPTSLRLEFARLCLRHIRQLTSSSAARGSTDADPAATLRRRALDQLRLADAESPGDSATLSSLVELLLQEGAVDEAFTYSRRLDALEVQTSSPRIRMALLNGFLSMPQERAEAILMRLAGDDPHSALPYLYLGELHYARHDLATAAEDYRHATAIEPMVALYWCKLAAMLADNGCYDLALAALQDGLTHLPDEPSLLELAGIVAATMQDHSLAADYLVRAETAFSSSPGATPTPLFHSTAAEVFTALRRPADAARHLLLAAEQHPASRPIERFTQHALMGIPSARRNAIRTLRAFARLSPEPVPFVHLQLALFALNNDNPKGALREFRKAIASLPAGVSALTPDLRFFYAVALDQSGRTDEAIAVLRALCADEPRVPEPFNYLAYTLAIHETDLPDALTYAQAALALIPDNYAFLDTLAWIHYKLHDYPAAWTAIQAALKAAPAPSEELVEHYNAIQHEVDPGADPIPLPGAETVPDTSTEAGSAEAEAVSSEPEPPADEPGPAADMPAPPAAGADSTPAEPEAAPADALPPSADPIPATPLSSSD